MIDSGKRMNGLHCFAAAAGAVAWFIIVVLLPRRHRETNQSSTALPHLEAAIVDVIWSRKNPPLHIESCFTDQAAPLLSVSISGNKHVFGMGAISLDCKRKMMKQLTSPSIWWKHFFFSSTHSFWFDHFQMATSTEETTEQLAETSIRKARLVWMDRRSLIVRSRHSFIQKEQSCIHPRSTVMTTMEMGQKRNHFKQRYRWVNSSVDVPLMKSWWALQAYRKHGDNASIYIDSKDETKVSHHGPWAYLHAGVCLQGKWEPLAKAQLKKLKDRYKDEERKKKAATEREVGCAAMKISRYVFARRKKINNNETKICETPRKLPSPKIRRYLKRNWFVLRLWEDLPIHLEIDVFTSRSKSKN